MLLICDSGSTKADWILAENGNIIGEYNTPGINPYFHNQESVIASIHKSEELVEQSKKIKTIHFFGAGCSSVERVKTVHDALGKIFSNANIDVQHDLLCSAIATCGDNPGIACILGTGSNSCYFDGKKIIENNHGIGYILGDEGSGSYYGRKLLSNFIYNRLPKNIYQDLAEKHHLTKEIIIENVYSKPNANVYLASFAKVLYEHKEEEFVKHLVEKGMKEFFENYVITIPEHKDVPVHFVGSIAHFFNDILSNVAVIYGCKLGKVIRRPISGLFDYYRSES